MSGWVSQVRNATSVTQVAMLLLSLESNTLWSAVQPAWRQIRPGWINALKGVQSGI